MTTETASQTLAEAREALIAALEFEVKQWKARALSAEAALAPFAECEVTNLLRYFNAKRHFNLYPRKGHP